jgi:hypothetical protein
MRLLTMAALSFLTIAGTVSPALCADKDKQQQLATCLFEVEKTMVLYNAIYENGYMGKTGLEAFQQIQEQIAQMPEGSAERQSLQRAYDAQTKQRNDRDKQIESSLMDKCMLIGGYQYTTNDKDPLCVNSKYDRVGEFASFCWEPAPNKP